MRAQAIRLLQRLQCGVEATQGPLARAVSACEQTPSLSHVLAQISGFHTGSSMCRSPSAGSPIGSSPALQAALRAVTTSAAPQAAVPLTAVAVEGSADAFIDEIDAILSSDSATAKDVADAAMGLTYLQVKGNRRIWGKLLEKASAVKGSFDAASLSSLLWALTAANVGHYKTVFELSGVAIPLLKSSSPAQLGFIVEAVGKAGVDEPEFFATVSSMVVAKAGDMASADLVRVLWGFAAAGVEDVKLAKAAGTVLAAKADSLSFREAAQALFALAKLRRADKAVDALAKQVGSKAGTAESPRDAVGALWALAMLGSKDKASVDKVVAAAKAGLADLAPASMIHLAWSAATLGSSDKDLFSAVFSTVSAAVEKAPDSLEPSDLALLAEAALLAAPTGAKPSDQVSKYALDMHKLVADHARHARPSAMTAFRADLAEAVAAAMGARYRPEVDAAVAKLPKKTADGLSVDMGADLGDIKVAIEAVETSELSSSTPAVPLGPVLARQAILEARGFKVLLVPYPEWSALADTRSKATYLLEALKKAVPSAAGRADALLKKLREPFDPYQE